jgi:uncharacterized protein (UPF0303 family)
MNIDQDLERIALQEKRLQFKSFDSGTAWELTPLDADSNPLAYQLY